MPIGQVDMSLRTSTDAWETACASINGLISSEINDVVRRVLLPGNPASVQGVTVSTEIRGSRWDELIQRCFLRNNIVRFNAYDAGMYLGVLDVSVAIKSTAGETGVSNKSIYSLIMQKLRTNSMFRLTEIVRQDIFRTRTTEILTLDLRGRFLESEEVRLPVGVLFHKDFMLPYSAHVANFRLEGEDTWMEFAFTPATVIDNVNAVHDGLALYGLRATQVNVQRDTGSISVCVTKTDRSPAPQTPANIPPSVQVAEILSSLLTDDEHSMLINCMIDKATKLYINLQGSVEELDTEAWEEARTAASTLRSTLDKVFPGNELVPLMKLEERLSTPQQRNY